MKEWTRKRKADIVMGILDGKCDTTACRTMESCTAICLC